ncbi:MAG TPA: hypothetical protein VE999_08480 [Gemmataceae bacterium]|nr:hypothetical protein [Gemmataceae bacterium]
MNQNTWFGCIFSGVLIACGGYMAVWPEDAAFRQKETDDAALVTATEIRWMRVMGIALITCGGVLLWATLTGLLNGGDVDPVLI